MEDKLHSWTGRSFLRRGSKRSVCDPRWLTIDDNISRMHSDALFAESRARQMMFSRRKRQPCHCQLDEFYLRRDKIIDRTGRRCSRGTTSRQYSRILLARVALLLAISKNAIGSGPHTRRAEKRGRASACRFLF